MFICARCQRDCSAEGLFCPFCGAPAPQGGSEPGDPYVGQTVAQKYFVHQLLGRGGMGQVYKATHLTLDRPVVLKMLNRALSTDASIVQRFHREARAASRLNHPNSINVIDFGQAEDGTLFIAMEYLPGRSLAKVIVEDFPLGTARVVKIGAQILAALTEAHAVGILHRDLKPENVMVESRRDDSDFVKVLDFGIAQLSEAGAGAGPGSPRLTQAGMVCGTPGYMSPEQARGAALDARSDLYSVGVVLYEMITGKLPFDGETPQSLVAQVLVDLPIAPSARRPDLQIDAELESLVMSALAPELDARPASAEDFRLSLLACAPAEVRRTRPGAAPARSTMVLEAGPEAPVTPRPRVSGAGASGARVSPVPAPRSSPPRGQPPPPRPSGPSRMSAGARPRATTPQPGPRATPRPGARAGTPRPGQRGPTPRPVSRPLRADADDESDQEEVAPPPPPRTPRAPLVLGSLGAAALLAAVASYAIFGGAREKPAAPVTAERQAAPAVPVPPEVRPASPEVRAEPEVRAAARDVPAEPARSPPQPAAIASRAAPAAPAGRRPARERKVSSARRSAPRQGSEILEVGEAINSIATPSVESKEGVLSIDATPWAEVSVNGRDLGETPREVRVPAGTYRVRASHPEFGATDRTMTVQAGTRERWAVTLAK